jgi:HEAT repeat protein
MLKTSRLLIPVLLVLSGAGSVLAEIRTEFEMDRDPEIRVPAPVKVFSERLRPLWLEALLRPEADMQRLAADAVGRAHLLGFPDMNDAIPGLVGILTAPSSHPAARLAAAQALTKLDAKDAAPQMAAAAEKYGADLRQVVEPTLAAWNYVPERDVWQARLKASRVHHRDLVLAIRCLATAGDRSRVGALLELVHDPLRPPAVRSAAALSAGLLQDQGLEADARRLIGGVASAPLIDRLCAARLIARHSSAQGQELLAALAVDEEPAVAVIALRRLIEIDPHLALPLAERAMQSADAKVRQCGADVCGFLPDPERIALLARLLDDPHPGVRGSVRESLFSLAGQSALEEPIRRAAMEMLAGQSWRGLEQAGLLLAALDHKPAADRFVALLDFPRPEVAIVAAWGLKQLAVPETLPAMLDKSRRNTDRRKSAASPPGMDDQTAHLLEAFGRMNCAAAEPLLREYVPKNFNMGQLSRSAAIWSLGLLHAGGSDEGLASQLAERASDIFSMPPELILVQTMSIVSIGRMRAVSQAPVLRRLAGPQVRPTRLGLSLRWALMELTGEQIPEPDPPTIGSTNWFLESLDD